MIQLNVITHTATSGETPKNALDIPAGVILNVTPHFMDYNIYDDNGVYLRTQYDVSFDVKMHKSLAAFKADPKDVISNSKMIEYDIAFTAINVDITALNSVDQVMGLLKDHIEQGGNGYPGIGIGNAAIVWPNV